MRVCCVCAIRRWCLWCVCLRVCVTADFHASPERRIFFGWDPILMRKDTHTPRSFSYSSCLALRNKKKMKNNFCFLLTPLIRMYPSSEREKALYSVKVIAFIVHFSIPRPCRIFHILAHLSFRESFLPLWLHLHSLLHHFIRFVRLIEEIA
jgi:hypothetical protein